MHAISTSPTSPTPPPHTHSMQINSTLLTSLVLTLHFIFSVTLLALNLLSSYLTLNYFHLFIHFMLTPSTHYANHQLLNPCIMITLFTLKLPSSCLTSTYFHLFIHLMLTRSIHYANYQLLIPRVIITLLPLKFPSSWFSLNDFD